MRSVIEVPNYGRHSSTAGHNGYSAALGQGKGNGKWRAAQGRVILLARVGIRGLTANLEVNDSESNRNGERTKLVEYPISPSLGRGRPHELGSILSLLGLFTGILLEMASSDWLREMDISLKRLQHSGHISLELVLCLHSGRLFLRWRVCPRARAFPPSPPGNRHMCWAAAVRDANLQMAYAVAVGHSVAILLNTGCHTCLELSWHSNSGLALRSRTTRRCAAELRTI